MKRLHSALAALTLLFSSHLYASSFFVGYEFGEMTLNGFQNFAGEIGHTFHTDNSVRLVYMDVALSERHLSSKEASAVDGDDVEGLWRGLELFYDIPLSRHISFSPSAGYYDSRYRHTLLDESVGKKSATAGFAFSYTGDNVFGSEDFYWRFSTTFRYYFNPLERTALGDSVVADGSGVEFVPWIFLGYKFD